MDKVNHISILVDRSGSTSGIAPGIIRQFNLQAALINEKAASSHQKTHLSLYTFSDVADRPLLFEVPMGLVTLRDITSADYEIGGMTALFDSVGMAIEDLSQFHRDLRSDADHSFLIVVLTDGQENASIKYSPTRNPGVLRRLMDQKVSTDMWSFVFLVPKGDKIDLVRTYGMSEGNVMEWDTTARGVEEYGKATSVGLTNFFAARASGKRSIKSFFSTDLSAVSMRDVNRQLDEVTMLFSKTFVRPNQNGAVIRDFCEREILGRNISYLQGNAYYELTKTETIQVHKKVVVENLSSGKLYGGPSARTLLGLPAIGEIRVRPGDHGNFKIYVQSTSVNRKLVGGTTVLYMKDRSTAAY